MTAAMLKPLPRSALEPRAARWRIGLVALATDHTSERDFARMRASDEVAIYANRIAYANPTTVENLRAMTPRLSEAAALILPGETLDALAFSCTAASVVIGDDRVAAALREAKPEVPCVTPVSAALAAFRALGITRLSVLTPYTPEVSTPLGDHFAAQGLDLLSLTCLGLSDDREMARIAPAAIGEAALEAMDPRAEGLFISCTALRAAEVAETIEASLDRPVVTSNQAMAWRALRLAGCPDSPAGFGRLWRQ